MNRFIYLMALACIALLFSGCGKSGGKPEAVTTTDAGKELFSAKNCVMCHGDNGEGRSSAPALRMLKQYYTKAQLIEYLKDPSAYADKTPRLAERRGMYPRMMPSFKSTEPAELDQLAEYVLSLE
jgi:mono/diheme cytochrome c family protein